MSSSLILRLGSDPTGPVHWIRTYADGKPVADGIADDLSVIAADGTGGRVVALAPGADVLLTEARVPTQSRSKLQRAIPYALEEQLAVDVDDAHFVLGDQTDGAWAVAVVQLDWLDAWLARLTEHGLRPDRLVPEPLCLPLEHEAWTVLLDLGGFQVRSARQRGFGGDADNLAVLLETALEEAGDRRPERVIVHAQEPPHALPAVLAGVPITVETGSIAALIAGELQHGEAPMNLLTGPYAPARDAGNLWRPWRPVAMLLAAWIILDLGLALLAQGRLESDIADTETRAMAVYQNLFPGATNLDQARTRVDNRLRQSGGEASDATWDMLDALRLIGPVLAGGEGFSLRAMSYRNGVLELELQTDSLQRLDALQQELDGSDRISAEVRSARSEDDAVQGRLVVRRRDS